MSYFTEYEDLLSSTLYVKPTKNVRTKDLVYTYKRTVSLLHEGSGIPIVGGRKVYLKSGAGECAWYLSGKKETNVLEQSTKMWSPWTEGGKVEASYGYRWANEFGVDQIEMAIQNLKQDPTSRRVYINTWSPRTDTELNAVNVPCPVGFHLSIEKKALDMRVVMRSSDLAVGLVYDTLSFRILQNVIANTLELETGSIEFVLLNAHIYGKQRPVVRELMSKGAMGERHVVPFADYPWTIDEVKLAPLEFVEDYKQKQHLIVQKQQDISVAV